MSNTLTERDILWKAIEENEDIVNKLTAILGDDQTDLVDNVANNFGESHEYYCLYYRAFFYKPWWHPKGIEFRPFRNVRIYEPYENNINKTFRRVGYYRRWLFNPTYTYQFYEDGEPCIDYTEKPKTLVTFQCGPENRVVLFRETKKCSFYELLFETPLNCHYNNKTAKMQNLLAIKKHGEIRFTYLHALFAGLLVFIVGSFLFYRIKAIRN